MTAPAGRDTLGVFEATNEENRAMAASKRLIELEAEVARLRKYIEEDAERWYAIHARADALGEMIFTIMCGMATNAPQMFTDVMRGLRVAEQMGRERNDHAAGLARLRKLNEILEDLYPDLVPKTGPMRRPRAEP